MLPRIKQLPEDLITRIAAGEVVERPASILKELIENSLDADSQNISIEIEGAGRNKILISDDGWGMTQEEAKLALRRHATSKISKLEDLETIATYGFRGEALPSIAAVSRFRLVTRAKEEETGWEFVVDGERLVSEKPKAREPGTTIEVKDIFFNTPARYKFLKSDATERGQCLKVIEEMSFASLPVTFRLKIEKNKPLTFQGRNSEAPQEEVDALKKRVTQAWGSRFDSCFLPLIAQTSHFGVKGVISSTHAHQATGRHQTFFINDRPVQNKRFSRALYEAYRGQLPMQRHPSWVLFLTVDPKTVDVNVHPTKREVKLTHENEIFSFLMNSAKQVLNQPAPNELVQSAAVTHFETKGTPQRFGFSTQRVTEAAKTLYAPLNSKKFVIPRASESIPDLASPEEQIKGKSFKAIAQVNRVFIISENEEGVAIVDQHAAQERVLYEKLLSNLKNQKPKTQMLLVPFTWEVSLALFPQIKTRQDFLQSMGFMIEPFGDNTFIIKGYPSLLGSKFDLHTLLDGLSETFGEKDFQHRFAAMAACKAAVKAGDALDLKECQAVLDQVVECDAPLTCPHGRPTFLKFSFSDLERQFRRT